MPSHTVHSKSSADHKVLWWSEKGFQVVGIVTLACITLRIFAMRLPSLSPFLAEWKLETSPFVAGAIYLSAALSVLVTVAIYRYLSNTSNKKRHHESSDTALGHSNACILSIGTALPPNEISMEVVSSAWEDHIATAMKISPEVSTWVKRRIEGSGIEKRWTVCPSLHEQFAGKAPGLYGDAPDHNPTAGARNRVWMEEATKLAIQSATAAMKNFNGSKSDITHVLFHSCTGFKAPGIELDIIEELGLTNVRRKFGVNFMGCFGGFTILQTAKYICDAEPGSYVLCVCAELCTLHNCAEDHRSAQMGVVLFGDASAAAVVGPVGLVIGQ
jgi:hypothetical protein